MEGNIGGIRGWKEAWKWCKYSVLLYEIFQIWFKSLAFCPALCIHSLDRAYIIWYFLNFLNQVNHAFNKCIKFFVILSSNIGIYLYSLSETSIRHLFHLLVSLWIIFQLANTHFVLSNLFAEFSISMNTFFINQHCLCLFSVVFFHYFLWFYVLSHFKPEYAVDTDLKLPGSHSGCCFFVDWMLCRLG